MLFKKKLEVGLEKFFYHDFWHLMMPYCYQYGIFCVRLSGGCLKMQCVSCLSLVPCIDSGRLRFRQEDVVSAQRLSLSLFCTRAGI